MKRDTGLKHAKGVDKITKAFDPNWYATRQAVSDQSQKLAVSAYRQSYMFWREKGREADDAKALALDDMKLNWA